MKGYRVGNKSSHGMKCYASGGRVSEDISDPGSLPKVSGPKMADGGMIDGDKAKPRLDRGAAKKGTTVNIVIAGGKGDQTPAPAPMPMPPPAPPMAGPPPVPPPMPPAGGPPIMRKHGGRVNKADGGPVAEGQNDPTEKESQSRSIGRKSGGRVNMDAGAGSGLGRLEKIGKK